MLHERRQIITGLAAILAAPALVRADSLMKLRGDMYRLWRVRCPLFPPLGLYERAYNEGVSVEDWIKPWTGPNGGFYMGTWTYFGSTGNVYTDKVIDFTKHEIVH